MLFSLSSMIAMFLVASSSFNTIEASPQVKMEGEKYYLSRQGVQMREKFSRNVFFSTSGTGLVSLGSVERRIISRRAVDGSSSWTPIAEISRHKVPLGMSSKPSLKIPMSNGLVMEIRGQPCHMRKDHLMFLASILDTNTGLRRPVMAGALPGNMLEKEAGSLISKFQSLLQDQNSQTAEKSNALESPRSLAAATAAASSSSESKMEPASVASGSTTSESHAISGFDNSNSMDLESLAAAHPVLFWFLCGFTLVSLSVLLVAFALLVRKMVLMVQQSRSTEYHSIPTYEEATKSIDQKAKEVIV